MRAAVYRGPNQLRTETLPVPRIGRNELLVQVAACGVCPTDIKKIQYGTVPPPRVFGHETAGTVVKIGAGPLTSRFKIGDRVALHHHVPCMDCHFCRHHAFAQCEQYKRTGITAGFEPAGGGFAEYVRVMPFVLSGVVKIPAKNSFEEGAMLEPVNTVLKAVKRLALLPGDNILVAGQGPIGLMFTKLLQLRGMNVLATDLLESRLQLAKKFGAKWTLNVEKAANTGRGAIPAEPEGRARYFRRAADSKPETQNSNLDQSVIDLPLRREAGERAGGEVVLRAQGHEVSGAYSESAGKVHPKSIDAAILAVPSDAALRHAFQLVRGAGQILLFAHTKRGTLTEVDLASVCVDEKDLLGSYSADFTLQKEVATLVFSRQLDVRSLITHRFLLEKTADAVALASHPTPESLKIIVCH